MHIYTLGPQYLQSLKKINAAVLYRVVALTKLGLTVELTDWRTCQLHYTPHNFVCLEYEYDVIYMITIYQDTLCIIVYDIV